MLSEFWKTSPKSIISQNLPKIMRFGELSAIFDR